MSEEMIRRRVMMAIAQGGGGGSSLPSEYQKVEYIQSNGSQYIDTGIYGNAGIKISARMAWVTASNTLFGSRKDAGATRFFVTAYNGIDFGYGNDKIAGIQIVTGQIYDFIYDTSAAPNAVDFYVDGVVKNSTSGSVETNTTMYIFAYHRGSDNGVLNRSSARFYSMKIEDGNGSVLFEGVPCYHKISGAIGIYDLATDAFFTNLGSGNFTKGDDV